MSDADAQPDGPEGEPRVPDLHLDRLESMARRAPRELARRADAAIARRAPALAPSRLRRRLRRRTVALLALLGLMAALASAWAVLRETSILRQAVESQLAARFGGEVSIGAVRWDGWDRITATDLRLRAPGWPGDAAQVASMRRAVVAFSPLGLLLGRVELVDMEIDGLTLRVIERADRPGDFGFLALRPRAPDGQAGGQPGNALLRDVRVEYGLLDDGAVRIIGSQQFDAVFEHLPDDATRYSFSLEQREQDGQATAGNRIRLFGTWDERTFSYEATLDGVNVDDGLLRMLPANARRWAVRSALGGRIEQARIEGSLAEPVRAATVTLRDVTVRERDAVRAVDWGRIEGGTVTPIRGDLTVSLGEAEVSVRGSEVRVTARRAAITPGAPGAGAMRVPLELSARCDLSTIGGFGGALEPDDAWMDRALSMVAYELDLRIPGADARPAPDGTPTRVELPMDAARALTALGARDWAADVAVSVRRRAGARDPAGMPLPAPVEVRGRLELLAGTVQSEAFPYPVTDVKGVVELEGDRLRVRGLRGRGNAGTLLGIDGETEISGTDPPYALTMTGRDVQLDRALVGAFREAPARIFGALMDEDGWEGMHRAGLVGEEHRPGGLVDFELAVRHARDGGERVEVTGTIDLRGVRFVLDSFPYPMTASGRLEVLDERVELSAPGVAIRTMTGGEGWIRGNLELPRVGDARLVRSFLDFEVDGDRVSPALLAAIPPSFEDRTNRPAGWPGSTLAPISEILSELGLQAGLSADGTVRTRPDESDAVTTRVRIAGGTIRPTERLAPALRRNGLSWPGRMALDDVRALVIADAGQVEVRDAAAVRGTGRAEATGRFDLDRGDGTLELAVHGFPLDRDLVRVTDGPATERALDAWDVLQPEGRFDGEVAWNRRDGAVDTYVHARPVELVLAGSVRLEPRCGDLYFRNGELRLDAVDLRGPDNDDTPLRIEAEGTILGAAPGFRAAVERLSLDSPLVERALEAAGATGALDVLRDWRIRGSVDASVDLPGRGTGSDWEVTVVPHWVSAWHDDLPIDARHRAGAIVAGPAGVRIDRLGFSLDRGTVEVDGSLAATDSSLMVGDLRVAALVAGDSPGLRALMPTNAREALEAVEFRTDAPLWTDSLRLAVDFPRAGSRRVIVTGDVGICDASLRTGVAFDRIDGVLAFDLATDGGMPAGTIGMQLDQLRALGRRGTNVSGQLAFDPDADAVRLEDAAATMYGGRITAKAALGSGGEWSAHLMCVNIGFGRFMEPGRAGAQAGAAPPPPPGRDGFLRGRMDIRGRIGDDGERCGSGRLAVSDARMMEFPLGMSLLQLTQLMLPLSASMDAANVEFHLVRDTMTLRRIDLSCGTLRLEGAGEVETSSGALALRFRNRGRFPLLSDLYGVVTDQFFAIDVGGTLSDPQPRVTPLPALAPAPVAGHADGTRPGDPGTEAR